MISEHPLLGTVISLCGGTFQMGSSKSDPLASSGELPQHSVTLSPFTMLQREVSQSLYVSLIGFNPSLFAGCASCPVESATWADAQAFAAAVSAETGENWRLPTEAEWEFAARGGQDVVYPGSDNADSVAWTAENSGGQTHSGCERATNGYGLCDMGGNVCEWVADWYGSYSAEPVVDPAGPGSGEYRVTRGGSWYQSAPYARVAHRNYVTPINGPGDVGFRLVRSDAPSPK